ncbi:MAG: radical SAM protein, partial [Acidimicrobiales bacterium]
HTAMRLALRAADAVRARRPGLPICFFGLYAGVAKELTVTSPADAIIGGEYEPGVVAWAGGSDPGPAVQLGRIEARVPDRRALPALDRYARLVTAGERRLVGSVATSRGCSHHCRHCPVPVVYQGRVRPVPIDIVLADVDQLVESGARHVSFADPDFLNAPHHSRRILHAMHDRHPDLSFDATIKVEHVLKHRALLPELADAGCAFVVSAFESVNDDILSILDKGHTAAQASEAVGGLRACGIEVRPSWLPFTPWTAVGDLVALFNFVIAHDLVKNVDPVQYSVRLLVPDGSLLLGEEAMTPHLAGYDPERLGWRWAHPDPVLDRLQSEIAALVEAEVDADPEVTFEHLDALVRSHAPGGPARPERGAISIGPRGERAHLSESWFCCSEPTRAQLDPVT